MLRLGGSDSTRKAYRLGLSNLKEGVRLALLSVENDLGFAAHKVVAIANIWNLALYDIIYDII
jgi:hypothetical protein